MAIFELENTLLSVKINSFGAELCSVISKKTDIEYIWQADKMVWARHAPNLFPIVGKLKDGLFKHESHIYQMPQHGFARDSEFVCIEQTSDFLLFELTASEQTLDNYPFHFSLQIGYKLKGNILQTSYAVFNPDHKDLYFSVGAHPAFNCPLQKGESFSDYELIFPSKSNLSVNTLDDGLITANKKSLELKDHKLQVSKQLFDYDALVFTDTQIEEVKLVSSKTTHGVSLVSKNWPYFGIWTKKGSEQFVCLEPWQGIADSDTTTGIFSDKTGVIKLSAEQQYDCSFEIAFF
ncbi:MAG: aldose 1-epimerase family protein [Bacteroidota bacterium]